MVLGTVVIMALATGLAATSVFGDHIAGHVGYQPSPPAHACEQFGFSYGYSVCVDNRHPLRGVRCERGVSSSPGTT